jgi:putative membrane protein
MCLLFFLLLAGTFFLVRRGHFGPPPWAGGTPWGSRNAPEADAKKILAERFANGDISSDEFMERASVLNWTPGAEPQYPQQGRNWKSKKRR